MLKNIRYRVALHYIKKAEKYIRKGDFKSILKGLDYVCKSTLYVDDDTRHYVSDMLYESAHEQAEKYGIDLES